MLDALSCRPLVRLAIGHGLGTALAVYAILPNRTWPFVFALGMSLIAWRHIRPATSLAIHAAVLGWWLLFVASGAGIALLHPNRMPSWPADTPVHLVGHIATDPDIRPCADSARSLWRFQIRPSLLMHHRAVTLDHARTVSVLVYGHTTWRGPRYGDRWEIRGTTDTAMRPGRAPCLRTSSRSCRCLSRGADTTFTALCYHARQAAARHLARGITDDKAQLLTALLLGYRGMLTADMRTLFAGTGALHIFAISGLHVGIIAYLLSLLLRLCRLSRVHWVWIMAPCLIAYTLATGGKPSAVRACIMAIMFVLAPALNRRADTGSTLAFAALVLLVWDPGNIRDIGFIYTITVVAGLILIYPRLHRWIQSFVRSPQHETPSLLDMNLTPGERLAGWLVRAPLVMQRYLGGLIALSISAWLVSAPLTAYFFGRFTPIALISNVLVVPLAFAIVLLGCLSLLCGAAVGPAALVFNTVNSWLIGLLVAMLRLFHAVPGLSLTIPHPPLWTMVIWYAALLGLMSITRVINEPTA